MAASAHLDNADFLMKRESYVIYGEKVYEYAGEECDKAIQINEKDFDSYHVRGNTYYYARQYSKAIPEYEKSLELNFNLKGAHYGIGLCYYYMDEFEKAASAFQTAIKIDPKYTFPDDMESPDAYQRLASCQEKLGDLESAIKTLTDAVNIHPDKVKYYILLGKLLKKKNDLDGAAEEFRMALTLDQFNDQRMRHIALTELADIYIDNGADLKAAGSFIKDAKKFINQFDAIQRDTEIFSLENTEGWILYSKNQFEQAINLLEKTLTNFLNEPKYHARLARAFEKYADTLSDPKLKREFKDKSAVQWEIVSILNSDAHLKRLRKRNYKNWQRPSQYFIFILY